VDLRADRQEAISEAAMPMNIQAVREVVNRCWFPGFEWVVQGDFTYDNGPTYLQGRFFAPDATAGDIQPQYTRKWLLSRHMTTSEIVQTVFKCALTAMEHEAREHFTYRGSAIFGPHFNVEALVAMRRTDLQEVR
jgi:hypothetical protein